jgi:hypothetical protein
MYGPAENNRQINRQNASRRKTAVNKLINDILRVEKLSKKSKGIKLD